jgi:hypothetical protein
MHEDVAHCCGVRAENFHFLQSNANLRRVCCVLLWRDPTTDSGYCGRLSVCCPSSRLLMLATVRA